MKYPPNLQQQAKAQLRQKLLAIRASLNTTYRTYATQVIAQRLEAIIHAHVEALKLITPVIACYHPTKGELDLTSLYHKLEKRYMLAWPRVGNGSKLTFLASPISLLKPSTFGISEPSATSPLTTPNIIIVPALGFTKEGYRIGYGKGYYDRTLEETRRHNPKAISIGACFAKLILNHLPLEPHDQKVDLIITEA